MTSPDLQPSSPDLHQIAAAFAVERQVLTPELAQLSEDKEKIAAGLLLCLSFASLQRQSSANSKIIADVQIERLDRIYPTGRNQGLIDFKLVCRLPTQIQVQLGICVLPGLDPVILNEAVTRLLVYKDLGLDRLCLLGHPNLITEISPLLLCLPKLLSTDIGGHFIPLAPPAVLTILTTLSVFQHRQQHQVTNDLIFAYFQQEESLSENELIKSILVTAQS
jgi:hypothetical protein